jgi:hypothetical protein
VNSIKASVIIEDVYKLMRMDPDQLEDREKADVRNALSVVLQTVWEAWWWAELMQCAFAQFADTVGTQRADGDNYGQGDVVLDPATDQYYIALGDDITGPPTSAGVTEADWTQWSGPTTTRWNRELAYTVRDRVLFGALTYECVTATTAAESPQSASAKWGLVADWTPTVPYDNYASPVVLTGPRGEVRSASRLDPRTTPNPGLYETEVTEDGTRIVGLNVGALWLWSRRLTPILTGDDYDATVTYEATDPQDLVFDA